jgi:hypothetical protein
LQDLLNAQNTFLGVWVFYEAQRRNLDQDLGTIRVDENNIWVDPGSITSQGFGFCGSSAVNAMPWNDGMQPMDVAPPVIMDTTAIPNPANPGIMAKATTPPIL